MVIISSSSSSHLLSRRYVFHFSRCFRSPYVHFPIISFLSYSYIWITKSVITFSYIIYSRTRCINCTWYIIIYNIQMTIIYRIGFGFNCSVPIKINFSPNIFLYNFKAFTSFCIPFSVPCQHVHLFLQAITCSFTFQQLPVIIIFPSYQEQYSLFPLLRCCSL